MQHEHDIFSFTCHGPYCQSPTPLPPLATISNSEEPSFTYTVIPDDGLGADIHHLPPLVLERPSSSLASYPSMPLRPPSRCCRAVQTTSSDLPIESIWFTENAPSRAFRLHIKITGEIRRSASSLPGPLYHRQSLGRRRMTELHAFPSAGSIPAWVLPHAPDLTQWKWQPPKALYSRHPTSQSDIDVQTSVPPTSTDLSESSAPEKPGKAEKEQSSNGENAVPREASLPSPLGLQLQALHNIKFQSGDEFDVAFMAFTRKLKLKISKSQIRGTQMFTAYNLGRRVLVRACRYLPELDGSMLPLLSAFINGISAASRNSPVYLRSRPHLWAILIKHLARQEIGRTSVQLFVLVMKIMPAQYRFRTRGAVLNVLRAYFKRWNGPKIYGAPDPGSQVEATIALQLASMWAGRTDVSIRDCQSDLEHGRIVEAKSRVQIAGRNNERARHHMLKAAHLMSDDRSLLTRLSDALKTHDPHFHRSLFVIATRLLGEYGKRWDRAQYNWLQILARLPRIRRFQFLRLLDMFPKRGHGALSHLELGDLFLLHWESQGMLKDRMGIRKLWIKIRAGDDSIALAALALAINKTHSVQSCTALLWSFWNFIRLRPGRRTVIKQVSSLSKLHSLSSGFLQRMAWTSNDFRAAVLLYDVFGKYIGRENHFWWSTFWDKFMMQYVHRWKYPLLDPFVLAQQIMGPVQSGLWTARVGGTEPQASSRQHLLQQQRQVSRIKMCIRLFAEAPQLTERQKLRYISGFTEYLAKVQGFLTANDLSSLSRVVLGALDRGEYGSKERLKWYLGIIYKHLGEDACLQVGVMIRRRREEIWLRWRHVIIAKRMEMEQRGATRPYQNEYKGPHQGKVGPLWRYWIPKNRMRTKLLRKLRVHKFQLRKVDARAPRQQPHERPTREHHQNSRMKGRARNTKT